MKKELLHIEKENRPIKTTKHKKTQIMLGNTGRVLSDYSKGVTLRQNGNYKRIPHYTISQEGDIKELLNPKYTSELFGYSSIDNQIISVLLENVGWVAPKNRPTGLCDWLGNIYKGEVFEKKWRDKFFWAVYPPKQVTTLCNLLVLLCERYDINRNFIGHNVRVEGVEKYEGVVNRSNYSDYFTDLSPAFNFEKIKEIL